MDVLKMFIVRLGYNPERHWRLAFDKRKHPVVSPCMRRDAPKLKGTKDHSEKHNPLQDVERKPNRT